MRMPLCLTMEIPKAHWFPISETINRGNWIWRFPYVYTHTHILVYTVYHMYAYSVYIYIYLYIYILMWHMYMSVYMYINVTLMYIYIYVHVLYVIRRDCITAKHPCLAITRPWSEEWGGGRLGRWMEQLVAGAPHGMVLLVHQRWDDHGIFHDIFHGI